jgi:glucose-1-phosphate cytidylyltransferase
MASSLRATQMRQAFMGELVAWQHDSFWQRMDTLCDERQSRLWDSGWAPWKVWER